MPLIFPTGFLRQAGGNDAFTKILLHMDGANAGTTFTENAIGGSAHTWTANSATTSTTQAKFGATSESCGAGVGWIDTPDSADFTLGSGDFTIDCWFYRSGGDGTTRFICGQVDSAGTTTTASARLCLNGSNFLTGDAWIGGAATTVTGTTAIAAVGWHHGALTRTGGNLKIWLDGVNEGTTAISGTVQDSANKFAVGRAGEFASLQWNGFIDEFRLSVGIARWTANFAPPDAAYS
jgi:hypothetical protein